MRPTMGCMKRTTLLMKKHTDTASATPVYRVVLAHAAAPQAEDRIRQVVEQKRGDLKALFWSVPGWPNQIHLHLGTRRIDDVLPALEGAGFDVRAVVAT